MKTTALLGLLLALAGCAIHYTKPGASDLDWANDRQFCDLYAAKMSEGSPYLQPAYARRCLEERGWRRT